VKLLIVEDEAKLADYLRKGLAEEGYVVEVAGNGIDGLHLATEGSHDLIVLDAMLPVIMLTARHRVEDRVRGLKAGADDYLVKPFAFSELVARIEVLLRRASGVAPAPDALVLTLGELELDMARRRATRAGQRLDLSAKEFQLLTLLMRRKGEVLSRTEIAEQVWDVNFDHGTNVIDVAIRRLRGKLDLPFDRPLLHTVRGMGYVLEERGP
jgi:DNA-binding response OmpR family regulator